MSRILLVRHCESAGQHAEAPLTPRGLAQAEALAVTLARFPIERIVSSPYLRARQTLAPFAARARLELEIDARLAERRLSAQPIEAWRDFMRASFEDPELCAPGGESGGETLARGRAALADALARGHELTALVGHGQHLSLLLHHVDGRFGYDGWQALTNPDLYLLETDARGGLRYARAWEGSRMRLTVLRVFVRDWPRAVRFYTETLGLPLAFSSEAMGWAQLDTGACQLALERALDETEEEAGGPLVGRFVGASLAVDDVEATWERLRARGVEFVAPPELMPWGGVLAHFRDPDGNVLTLVGPPRTVTPPRA